LRRRPLDAALLQSLQQAATDKKGPPTEKSADGRWIEQRLVRGLVAEGLYEASKLAISAGGWLFVSVGSGTSRAESWDGSRVAVVRSGAILRMRPAGSQLELFACGLLRPGQIAFDSLGRAFGADDDWTVSGGEGLRLSQILAGGDYGWQQAAPAAGKPPAAAADPLRAAAGGERVGTLPPLHRASASSAGDVAWWDSAGFPDFCQGKLLSVQLPQHRL
jgi:glucose/arabinose dehydrogenase